MFMITTDLTCDKKISLNLSIKSSVLYIESHGPNVSKIIFQNKEFLKVPIGMDELVGLFDTYDPVSPSVSSLRSPKEPGSVHGRMTILNEQELTPRSTKALEDIAPSKGGDSNPRKKRNEVEE